MGTDSIREAIERSAEQLTQDSELGRGTTTPARAVLEDGLRVRVEGPNDSVVVTDMSKAVGGDGSGPSPGWVSRAALASCDATVVAMRAAHEGIELSTLEVIVESESDSRGMLGVDDSVPPGPLSVRTRFRLGADGVSPERLEALVEWAEEHSPVGDAFRRAVDYGFTVEIV